MLTIRDGNEEAREEDDECRKWCFRSDYEGWKQSTTTLSVTCLCSFVLEKTVRDEKSEMVRRFCFRRD